MKVLIFEYITGGGFNKQALPDSLVQEGQLMLQALLACFAQLHTIQVQVMLDSRLQHCLCDQTVDIVLITSEHNSHDSFAKLVQQADAVWPIAPEFDGILQSLCEQVEAFGKPLLNASSAAVALTGNKYLTYQRLLQHHIPTVPTELFENARCHSGDWIIKQIDGAGCSDSFLVSHPQGFDRALQNSKKFIIQPHIEGRTFSLSCLFRHGQAWLLSVNLQHFQRVNQHYQLQSIHVNYCTDTRVYADLATTIACAMPELWGYVGIDLIETAAQKLVLEINPRLTTSFTGLQAALGLNVAELVLELQHGLPTIKPTRQNILLITVNPHDTAF
ncbi:MAG: ATP-grasp domain-containing protein [Methylococcaceae bacterium]|jgi:predicted ATP-grasp superfamily ATP-dependent carboligase